MRTQEQLLESMCQLLEEQLAAQRHILAALGSAGPLSSVELVVDSKNAVKPTVKVYSPDPDAACAKAQELFDDLVIKYGPKTP